MSRTTRGIVYEDIELCVDLIVESRASARPTVVGKQRVNTAILALVLMPRQQASAGIGVVVVVSKVVVLVSWPNPQMELQEIGCHYNSWCEQESSLNINGTSEIVRGKQNASPFQRIVPISIREVVASRSPAVACRDPDPVRIADGPVAGAPGITSLLPAPASGNPDVLSRRCDTGRTIFQRRRRCGRMIFDFGRLRRNPGSGHPLKASVNLSPVTWQPAETLWNFTPDSADPHKVVLVFVPGPISGNPLHRAALWTNIRGQLFNRFRRFGLDQQTGDRVGIELLGVRLVHWTAQHDFTVFVGQRVSLHRRQFL
jgi:hypothetical protein